MTIKALIAKIMLFNLKRLDFMMECLDRLDPDSETCFNYATIADAFYGTFQMFVGAVIIFGVLHLFQNLLDALKKGMKRWKQKKRGKKEK